MAAYPTDSIVYAARVNLRSGRRVSRTVSQKPRIRDFAGAAKRGWAIRHEFQTQAELDSWESFFDTNRTSAMTLSWGGNSYNVVFGNDPVVDWNKYNYWIVEVDLLEE